MEMTNLPQEFTKLTLRTMVFLVGAIIGKKLRNWDLEE